MAWYERDYYRNAPPRFGRLPAWSVTTWLIVINVAVYVLNAMIEGPGRLGPLVGRIGVLYEWGHFSAETAIQGLQLWRFITFQFLHADLGHLFFNMLSLYFFGGMIESFLGKGRFIAFYLLCGMAGAGLYLILWKLRVLIGYSWTPMVGASAGIFGILIGAARIAPHARVMLMFPPIPMSLRTLAWVLIGIALVTIATRGNNAGGEAAHVGGAALGYLLIENPWLLNIFNRLSLRGPRRRNKAAWRQEYYR